MLVFREHRGRLLRKVGATARAGHCVCCRGRVPTDRVHAGIFITSFDTGGTESQMLELASRLDRHVFSVHLACFNRRGTLGARAARLDVPVTEFPLLGFGRPRIVLDLGKFASWCVRNQLAIVQTAGLHANIFGLAGAALARVPVRVGSRRSITSFAHRPALRRLQRHAYRLAHHVVANSHAAAAALIQDRIPHRTIVTIPNGIDLALRPFSRNPGAPRVVVVANLRAEKGHDVLVVAACHVLARRPDVIFQLAGDGPMRRTIEQLVERHRVAHSFEFLGFRDDVPEVLAAAGVFVLPSRTEALPNAVMEAMAAQLPIVATARRRRTLELIRHDRDGLLIPSGDPVRLAEAILAIVADPCRARRFGVAARVAVEQFTFQRQVRAYQELYLTALAPPSGL